MKQNLFGQVYPSSTGKYIMWYDRKARNYFAWDGYTTINITEKIKVPLWDEEYDQPDEPTNYGVMGWHEEDSSVYVYDKYDVWKIGLQGDFPPVMVTLSGRKNSNVYRYIKFDPDENYLRSAKSVYFRTQNRISKQNGISFKYQLKEDSIFFTIPLGPYQYDYFVKAKN